MNNSTFNAGFKMINSTINGMSATKDFTMDTAKAIPQGFVKLGHIVADDVCGAATAVSSFFSGMTQAVKFRSGKCKLLPNPTKKV